MIYPSDPEYQKTRERLRAGAALPTPFRELGEWVSSEFGVTVLDVHHDTTNLYNRPRLNVVLRHERERERFLAEGLFDRKKQARVATRFVELLAAPGATPYATDGLFVIFSAFDHIARTDANERVTQEQLDHLRAELNDPSLWTISRRSDVATFFFHTDAQKDDAESKGLRATYADAYARLVAPYDEFGCFADSPVHVAFDSKENFDTHYAGNWYYYYK